MRMPVGKREIFITFRVGALLAQPLLGPCCLGECAAKASCGERWKLLGAHLAIHISKGNSGHLGGIIKYVTIKLLC